MKEATNRQNSEQHFRKLTAKSIEEIDERIRVERTRLEIEKTDAGFELSDAAKQHSHKKTASGKHKPNGKNAVKKKVPDKDFEAGSKLPSKYKKLFPKELFGVPIEELDDFYKTDYVTVFF
jgi:hypothetical protein